MAVLHFLADNWWLLILFAPSVIMGMIVFLMPVIEWHPLWRENKWNNFDPHYFWRAYVRLAGMPKKGLYGYTRLSNLISLFWIWGYFLHLAGWIALGILRGALWIYRHVLRDYFRYVSDLFKTK